MLVIIGCGNPTRCDEGVGSFVARRMRAHIAALGRNDVRAFDAGIDGETVLFAARGSDALVIVDASRTGVDAGVIYDVPAEVLARDYSASLNLRDFRWDHALAAGKRIFGSTFPASITVLLVEAELTDFGLDLSAPVAAAAESVVARLKDMVNAYHEPARETPA